YAVLENGGMRLLSPEGKPVEGTGQFQLAIISSGNDFYQRMKFLESQGIPRNRIIDGRVFQVPNLDFQRLLNEGIAYGVIENNFVNSDSITYPRFFKIKNSNTTVAIGVNSYMSILIEDGIFKNSSVSFGNFSSIAWNVIFELGLNGDHNFKNVGQYGSWRFGWDIPNSFLLSTEPCKILIGNDVWIGRGCILKCSNPNKPLIIGDGAVISSDSVVVKSVPPYAIVGGNPAQIIKYRFPEDVIESLLRIKWWDWSLDKIHDNFKYFNDVEKFIALHDRS
ncbi:MAG: hypothetical protein IKN16_03070, partial [Selenomonadaceae bacterium]|nr:hypothetical protein [Selenomonadaceae bacterium]